jgi:hypothetical protein
VTTACWLSTAAGLPLAAGRLPLAAGWEQIIIGAIAVGIWALNQFLGARNKPQAPRPNRPQPAPPRPGGQPAGQKGLLDEVEQFLKDARKQMEKQQRPQPQKIQPPPTPQQQARRLKQQQAAKAKQAAKARQPLRPAGELRPLDDIERGTSVEQHVREHVGGERFNTSRFDERAGKLSHLQQTIDQDIGAHVKSVFDHQVGSMTTGSALGGAGPEPPPLPTPAQQLIAMLGDPQGMRNAILLQEILRPPVERW